MKRFLSLLILLGITFVLCVMIAELARVNPAITIVVLMSAIGVVLSVLAIWLDVRKDDNG